MDKGPIILVVVIALCAIAFYLYRRNAMGDVGGLTFAQAGAQKAQAVAVGDAASGT